MSFKQVSVFVENKPGRLAQITGVLAKEKIDIRALSVADTTDFGILRMIVTDPDRAKAALREAGCTVSTTEVLGAEIDDIPGGLHRINELMFNNDLNIEYVYAFLTRGRPKAHVILKVSDMERAGEIMKAEGIYTLSQEDIL